MLRLLKLKYLITIVLLNCFINLFANDRTYLVTGGGEFPIDSVLVSYDDLRIANSKMIELEYEKEINVNLKNIIYNDSIIIQDYENANKEIIKNYNKAIKQRNISIISSFVICILTLTIVLK